MRKIALVLLSFGWVAYAQTAILSPDMTCRDKDDKPVFSLHLEAANSQTVPPTKTYFGIIQGTIPFDLATAFPRLDVEMNDFMLVAEPQTMLSASENPYDIEFEIDRISGKGRFSAVANKTQATACATCDDAIEINCSDRSH